MIDVVVYIMSFLNENSVHRRLLCVEFLILNIIHVIHKKTYAIGTLFYIKFFIVKFRLVVISLIVNKCLI